MKNMTWWLARISLIMPIIGLLSVVVLVNIVSIKHISRTDLTAEGIFSVSEQTAFVINQITKPIDITFFYDSRSKAMQDAKELLKQYDTLSDLINVQLVDPQLQPAIARQHNVRFAGTSIFSTANRQVIVNRGDEVAFTNGIIKVSADTVNQQICFTDGHVESDPMSLKSHDHMEGDMGENHDHSSGGQILELHERHGIGMAKDALETLGYQVRKVLLSNQSININNCTVMVIASPQQAFTNSEIQVLNHYLDNGGSALFMLEPQSDGGLSPLLNTYGIAIEPGSIIDEAQHYWTDAGTPAVTDYSRHEITRNLGLTFFPGAASLIPSEKGFGNAKVHKLIQTSDTATVGHDSSNQTIIGKRVIMVEAIKAITKSKQNTQAKHSRIIVIGDGDFATNSQYHILGNGNLFINIINSLSGESQLIDIIPKNYQVPKIELTNLQMISIFMISTVLMPAILAIGGLLVWKRRRFQ